MIRLNLSKFMGINKMTIQEVHEKTGLSRNAVSDLYHESVKLIRLDTIERLCELFNVQPGELLEWVKKDGV